MGLWGNGARLLEEHGIAIFANFFCWLWPVAESQNACSLLWFRGITVGSVPQCIFILWRWRRAYPKLIRCLLYINSTTVRNKSFATGTRVPGRLHFLIG